MNTTSNLPFARLKRAKQNRYNPLPNIGDPSTLTRKLDAFEVGYLKDAHDERTEKQETTSKESTNDMTTKSKQLRRALAQLVAAARVRWLQKEAQLHNILDRKDENRRLQIGDTIRLANIAEGTHDGNITKAVDAVITERFLLARIGSASDRVAVAGAADTPIGIITDEAAAIGDYVNVALLGARPSTVRMVASGAIAQGALLEPAASGRVQTLGAGVGTHHVVGRALDAATNAGDVIEVDPLYFLRVI